MLRFLARWPTIVTLQRLWPFVRPERRRLAAAFAVAMALTAIEVATPVLLGLAVDGLLAGMGRGGPTILGTMSDRLLIAALVAAAPLRGVLLAKQRAQEGELGQKVTARIRKRMWVHVQKLPVAYANRRGPGRLLLRFIGDARAIQRMVGAGLVRLSQDLLVAVGILIALAALNWRMSLAVLPLVPLHVLIFARLNPRLRKESRARRRRRSRLSAYIASRAASLAVAKSALGRPAEMARFDAANRGIAVRGSRVAAANGAILGWSAAAVAVSGVLVLIVAAGEAEAGRLSAGVLVTYYALLGLLAPIFQRVAIANRYVQEGRISLDRIAETLAMGPEVPPSGAPALVVSEGRVSLESVSFRHGVNRPLLDEASLTARRGEIVAIAGANGAGKSTLLELLLRFRDPTGGRICIDGQDIALVHPESLRAQIGYVPQRAPLFDGTAAENVAIAVASNPSPGDLERAARQSGADAVVARLENGWETVLAEGRRALSNGERRRLALARALLGDPPILLLDEPTADLDGEGERQLGAQLRALATGKTIIIAGDRIPDSFAVDRVYRLEDGRVVEMPLASDAKPRRRGQATPATLGAVG